MTIGKKVKVGAITLLSMGFMPSVIAYADEGVVMQSFTVQDENGKTVKEFHENDLIHLEGESENTYTVTINQQSYNISKSSVLKTSKTVEESLTITGDEVALKATPDMFGSVIFSLKKGEVVYRIPEAGEQQGFIKVRTSDSVEGWVMSSFLQSNTKEVPVITKAFIGDDTQKRNGLDYGESVSIIGYENGHYKASVNGTVIDIDKSSISFQKPPKRQDSQQRLADQLIKEAYKYMGVPYVWGGTTPDGFDCSGFTQYVSRKVGISLPRVASEQATVGEYVDRDHLRKGDFVFFETYKPGPSHLGIYIGNGKFIHAGGDKVHISDLRQPYYAERYLFAKRMF